LKLKRKTLSSFICKTTPTQLYVIMIEEIITTLTLSDLSINLNTTIGMDSKCFYSWKDIFPQLEILFDKKVEIYEESKNISKVNK
jgi:hypothetical protein